MGKGAQETLKVEQRKVAALKPYARNSRRHPPGQIEAIAASIREWGFTIPLLVDENDGLIAGHGRLEAAKSIGLESVPVLVARGWTDTQVRAYVIADNQIAAGGEWDKGLLKAEITDLRALGFDLKLLAFDASELRSITLSGEDQKDPDETPPVQAEVVAKVGDIWLLGEHRVACGDSTDPAVVSALLGDRVPHLMVTDPPYGVEYDANWCNEATRSNGKSISGRAVGKVLNDDRADWTDTWKLFPGDVAYVWHAGVFAGDVQTSLTAAGFQIRSQIIWAKQQFAIGRGHYHWQHEPCWYAVRESGTGHWVGGRKQTTLWQIDKPQKSETGHSTQKPVECMKRPIENNSNPSDWVYDPFLGSGTTLVAATITARRCLGIELNPAYVDVIVRRWEALEGKAATLEATGATFADTAKARKKKARK